MSSVDNNGGKKKSNSDAKLVACHKGTTDLLWAPDLPSMDEAKRLQM